MIQGMHHIGISTPDAERLEDFYRTLFGFETVAAFVIEPGNQRIDRMVGRTGVSVKVIMMRCGNAFIELVEPLSPAVVPAPPDRSSLDHGLSHICLHVTDLAAEHARLSALGMRFSTPPFQADLPVNVVYGSDPDGNFIELLEVLDPDWPFHFEKRYLDGAVA